MECQKRIIRCRLRKLNDEKKLINVFDEARNNALYKSHRKYLKCIKKKVDNFAPIYASSNFFPQRKLQVAQNHVRERLRQNLIVVNFLNAVQRNKGKVDCFNPIAAHRKSKIPLNILKQKDIEFTNRKIARNLNKIEPTRISCTKHLLNDWEVTSRRLIIENSKYPVAINGLLRSDYDVFLEDPPSYCEYKRRSRIFLDFHVVNHGDIGKIVIMLNDKIDQEIRDKFIRLCFMKDNNDSYQGTKVHKIIQGILIEAGDMQTSCPIYPNMSKAGYHDHVGTISMLLEDNGSISSKFSITLKKLPMLNGKQFVIGRVVKGLDVLSTIENYGSRYGLPRQTILIKNCGLVK